MTTATATATLAEFLLARISDDEDAADLVLRFYGDHANAAWWVSECEWFKMGLSSYETPLVTRMNPARVLADCAARRAIVELHGPEMSMCDSAYIDETTHRDVEQTNPCPTLRQLASVYSDHPDYDPAWAVS